MMGRRCYVLLRRRYDVPIRRCGDAPLRRLGDVPSRRRQVFDLRCTCDVIGMYRETSLRRRHDILMPGGSFIFILIALQNKTFNNGILLKGVAIPKLLKKPFASCSFTNLDFLIPQIEHLDCITNILFFVLFLGQYFQYSFYTLRNKSSSYFYT